MRTQNVLFSALVCLCLTSAVVLCADPETFYYAIEINGVLCGYSEIVQSQPDTDTIHLDQKVHARLTALGSQFDSDLKLTYRIDSETGRFVYHDSEIRQGPTHLSSQVTIDGRKARFVYGSEERTVELPADAILENTLFHPHLKRDFAEGGADRKTYSVLDVRDAEVQRKSYTRIGSETLELAGRSFQALELEELNHKTGMRLRISLDSSSGRILRVEIPGQRKSYLSDSSIVKRIQVASLDGVILKKANLSIADFQAISHMKVRASLQPSGVWVTLEGLSVPGQSFSGTVEENRIEGVFDIRVRRYDGTGAPLFPPDFRSDESLNQYLKARDFIESDDPVLVAKAREITGGSQDSWQAATRLSRWVATNIAYSVPGGTRARKTYEMKAGECGAHSFLLASFCRAVGIPARVVWGCLYTPNQGGAFGQHAWNEVYMGKAGWIPIDSTASETDYLDSGHIRIGEYQSVTTALNPATFEILDYSLFTRNEENARTPVTGKYEALVGAYINPSNQQRASVVIQDGALALDIRGKIILALNDPDEAGNWQSKMSDRLYCRFEQSRPGQADQVVLHQLVQLTRRSPLEEMPEDVPDNVRPFLGKYLLPQLQVEFAVLFRDGTLAVNDPVAKRLIRLKPTDLPGRWTDEFDKNGIYFEYDDTRQIKAMIIDSVTRFQRQEQEGADGAP